MCRCGETLNTSTRIETVLRTSRPFEVFDLDHSVQIKIDVDSEERIFHHVKIPPAIDRRIGKATLATFRSGWWCPTVPRSTSKRSVSLLWVDVLDERRGLSSESAADQRQQISNEGIADIRNEQVDRLALQSALKRTVDSYRISTERRDGLKDLLNKPFY